MTRLRTLSTDVAWRPWGRAAFTRAHDERKPVLLAITAEWCGWCREMDRASYTDPTIATTINERFVPLRVDADERPDISERYSLGGWPTTAFLTPDGAIAGGGTYVPASRMGAVLEQVVSAFAAQPDRVAAPAGAPVAGTPGDLLSEDRLSALVFESFDDQDGGFGPPPRFPLDAPLRLALALRQSHPGDAGRFEEILVTSLDAMGWGGLYDEGQGGVFRCATARGWQAPQTAKLLAPNAALVRLYLDAGAALGIRRFSERGADILRYLQAWLAEPHDGGWFGSQQGDDRYYGAEPGERAAMVPPAVSGRLYADANASMVSAALHAAGLFDDEGLRDFALKSLERVLLSCYKPGDGVAHYHDGHRRARGLLADQVSMAAACLDAFAVTGNIVYEMMAEELMHYSVRTMWNDADGGFYDRAEAAEDESVGLMRVRLTPFVNNCEAAQVLNRLAERSGDLDFSTRARATLAAVAPLAAAHGPLAAHYVLAMRDAPVR